MSLAMSPGCCRCNVVDRVTSVARKAMFVSRLKTNTAKPGQPHARSRDYCITIASAAMILDKHDGSFRAQSANLIAYGTAVQCLCTNARFCVECSFSRNSGCSLQFSFENNYTLSVSPQPKYSPPACPFFASCELKQQRLTQSQERVACWLCRYKWRKSAGTDHRFRHGTTTTSRKHIATMYCLMS